VLNLPSQEVKQAITTQYLLAMLCRVHGEPESPGPNGKEAGDDNNRSPDGVSSVA
jgi:hypothetical protein